LEPVRGFDRQSPDIVLSEAVLVLVIVIELLEITESITSNEYAHEHEKRNWPAKHRCALRARDIVT